MSSREAQLDASQPGLDPAGQGSEVGHSLQFVVGKLDVEMMLEPGKQIERLQAVDPERLEEIIVGSQFLARHFELRRRQVEDLVQSLFDCLSLSCHLILVESDQGK